MRFLICSCVSSLHFLELAKKGGKHSFQLINYYATDPGKSKNDKISLKKMYFKISLYRTFNVSRRKMILAKFHCETTQTMS